MIPVFQDEFYEHNTPEGRKRGNCFAACLASILELPLHGVPPFHRMFNRSNWDVSLHSWLALYDLEIGEYIYRLDDGSVPHSLREPDQDGWLYLPNGSKYKNQRPHYFIASGPSPNYPPEYGINHAVVWHQGKVVHDPNPNGKPMTDVRRWRRLNPVMYYDRVDDQYLKDLRTKKPYCLV